MLHGSWADYKNMKETEENEKKFYPLKKKGGKKTEIFYEK